MKLNLLVLSLCLYLASVAVEGAGYTWLGGKNLNCPTPDNPDPYYTQCVVRSGKNWQWIDISATGTKVPAIALVPFPFDFVMYGATIPAGSKWIFGSSGELNSDAFKLTALLGISNYDAPNSGLYYQSFGQQPNRYMVFTWENHIKDYCATKASVQLRVYENYKFEVLIKEFTAPAPSGCVSYVGLQYSPPDGGWQDTMADYPMTVATPGDYGGKMLILAPQGVDISEPALPPVTISSIPKLVDQVCSPAVTITSVVDGIPLTFDTFDSMSGCDVFSDSSCSSASEITTTTVSGGSAVVYLKCKFTYYQKLSVNNQYSNIFQVVGQQTGGNICGDPHFIGYDGKEFTFDGIIGDYYNIFTAPYLSINSLLKDAGGANPYVKTSVNGAMGLMTHDFNITLDPVHYDDTTKTIMYVLNGQKMTIAEDTKVVLNGGCLEISFQKDVNTRHHHHTFEVMTRKFKVFAYVSKDSNKYINTDYLDYFIAVDKPDADTLGGIIGDTAKVGYNADDIIDHPENYHMSGALQAGAKYHDVPVCGTTKTVEKRKNIHNIDTPDCQALPDGYQCWKHRTCVSGMCGRTHVCMPWDGCLADRDCSATSTCVDGHCKVQVQP